MSEFFNLDFSIFSKEKDTFDYDFKEIYNKRKIDLSEELIKPKPLISIGGRVFKNKFYDTYVCTLGEMSAIVAPSKTMKSVLASVLAGAVIGGDNFEKRFPVFKSHRDSEYTILHFDTEQGAYHAQKTFRRSLEVSEYGYSDYHCFALRSETAENRLKFIDDILVNQKSLFDSPVRMVIIDGIADLVDNTNDIVVSKMVSDYLMKWTDSYELHIVTVIHKLLNSDKPVGHLGSFVVKKAETVFLLSRNDDTKYIDVHCSYSRDFPFEPFQFYLDDYGTPYQTDATIPNDIPFSYSIDDESTRDKKKIVTKEITEKLFNFEGDIPF